MKRIAWRQFIFHPATVLVISLTAAGIFALLITLLFERDFRWFLLYYHVPIGIPFVAFLFDRAERYAEASGTAWGIDLVVLIVALTRAFVRLPLVSGHALFLIYCLLTSRLNVARMMSVLVLFEVAYLKLFITHDTALFGGLVAGVLAAILYRRITPSKRVTRMEPGL